MGLLNNMRECDAEQGICTDEGDYGDVSSEQHPGNDGATYWK